jgi:hypothetical protein
VIYPLLPPGACVALNGAITDPAFLSAIEIMHVPSASIMRVDPPHIKVFVSSTCEGNPCEPGALDTGPYCETVMKTGQPLLIPDALENEACANPRIRLGMMSYLGVPIGWPNGRMGRFAFATIRGTNMARLRLRSRSRSKSASLRTPCD